MKIKILNRVIIILLCTVLFIVENVVSVSAIVTDSKEKIILKKLFLRLYSKKILLLNMMRLW